MINLTILLNNHMNRIKVEEEETEIKIKETKEIKDEKSISLS
ncbi:MAG: hypothetical protein ACFFB0_14450 [Promethearchaeota archaeon]